MKQELLPTMCTDQQKYDRDFEVAVNVSAKGANYFTDERQTLKDKEMSSQERRLEICKHTRLSHKYLRISEDLDGNRNNRTNS